MIKYKKKTKLSAKEHMVLTNPKVGWENYNNTQRFKERVRVGLIEKGIKLCQDKENDNGNEEW